MNKITFTMIYIFITGLLCFAIGDMMYAIIILLAMLGLYFVLYNAYFNKNKKEKELNNNNIKKVKKKESNYKDVIKKARMEYIFTKVNNDNYVWILKHYYVDMNKYAADPDKPDIIYHANFTLEQKIENLENVYNEIKENKWINKKIIKGLEETILYGKNKLKYTYIINNGELYANAYYMGIEEMEHTFYCGASYKVANKINYDIYAYDGKLFFFNYDSYELNEEFTISNQELSSIERFIYKESVDEYKPHYQNVKKPVNMTKNFNSPVLKKEYEDKYKREVAEYSANLILAEQHNKEEEKKYRESIGKTKDRIAVRFWYKEQKKDGVFGLVFIGLNKFAPNGFTDVDFIINK